MSVTAIVPAAGSGKRLGAKKPFIRLLGKPLIIWTLQALSGSDEVSEIIPVFSEADMAEALKLIEEYSVPKIRRIARGGTERQHSVYNGLCLLRAEEAELVLIHDGARPLVDGSLIATAVSLLKGYDGTVTAVPVKDTIKEASEAMIVQKTLRRNLLWAVQTPQVFKYSVIMSAYEKAFSEGVFSTDDSGLVERYGGKVRLVMGSYENLKITTAEDIAIAEMFLKKRM